MDCFSLLTLVGSLAVVNDTNIEWHSISVSLDMEIKTRCSRKGASSLQSHEFQ